MHRWARHENDGVRMSRGFWQVLAPALAAVSVLAFGAAGARALTSPTGSRSSVIAERDRACPPGSVDKNGFCADADALPQKPAQPPQLLRSPSQQMQNVIQSIQNLKYKCGPTQSWSAQAKACIDND
jgi:hypothetical protein